MAVVAVVVAVVVVVVVVVRAIRKNPIIDNLHSQRRLVAMLRLPLLHLL